MKSMRFLAFLLLVLGCALLAISTTALALPTTSTRVAWIDQLGTSSWDWSWGVSADGLGNVYISGSTEGGLKGTNAGDRDAFVSKYNASGTLLWTGQLGTSSRDGSTGVSADGLGNVYISGNTRGSLERTNAGFQDVFVSKYDTSGTLLWTTQFGTSSFDSGSAVSADGLGNVYITGSAGNLEGTSARGGVFVRKYDANGTILWTEQLSTTGISSSSSVSADGLGNVYISGYIGGRLERDAIVSKYDASGTLLWTEQLGTSSIDFSMGVSADGLGNVYITGGTQGNLEGTNAGLTDAFISKYDASGTRIWTTQLGTSSDDLSSSVSADGMGNVYISGRTRGSFEGTNPGGEDAFVSKFDATGTLLWTEQLGTSSHDRSWGVSADGLGNVYSSGVTLGSLGGSNAGGPDAFIVKLVPEPSSAILLLMGALVLLGKRSAGAARTMVQ